jgi:cytochrome c553
MRGHFEQARIARAALTRADLKAAREAMAWLAGHPLADTLPESAQPRMAAFQAAAGEFEQVRKVRDGALALARIARQCGECHRAMEMGPSFARPPLPEGENAISHMRRHHWAANRMWEGLVAGDPELYAEAAQGFAEPALSARELGAAPVAQAELESLIRHVHQLGARAGVATDDAARAEIYGELLASCAGCHRALERGPSPLPAP